MKKNKTIRFVQSFLALPLMLSTLPFGPQAFINNQVATEIPDTHIVEAMRQEDLIRKERAQKIDRYFEEKGLPMAGYGMKMVFEAEENDIDWALIPAIAMRESTGGKFACKKVDFSPFGFGSCKMSFDSYDHAIEVVAKNLGGNNPNTARHYANKETRAILQAYNPPSIVPRYAEQVMGIMEDIANS